MIRNHLLFRFGMAFVPLALSASIVSAAASFSNSLAGFTGDSTQLATQTAVAAAGFSFSSTLGETEDPPGSGITINPTINFDAAGAHFGDLLPGNNGRNYIRTNDADYANVSFVAEITFEAGFIDFTDVYFGMGAGNIAPAAASYTPDWQTLNSSVMYWGESEIAVPDVTVYVNNNGDGPSTYTPAPLLGDGTHRVRLSYDRYKQAATFSFDFNYAGGPFTADTTAPAADVSALYGSDGWTTEPARIFFGGDENLVLKDFQVTVTTAPVVLLGDFDNSGTITAADWSVVRSNQHVDLTGLGQHAAYLMGDMNGDFANNYADFVAFKSLYDDTHGAGSFAAMVAGVPEPSTLVLLLSIVPMLSVALLAAPARRRTVDRG